MEDTKRTTDFSRDMKAGDELLIRIKAIKQRSGRTKLRVQAPEDVEIEWVKAPQQGATR